MGRELLATLGIAALLCACGPAPMSAPASGSAPPPDLAPAEPVANELGSATVDRWVGTWVGPEGTSFKLAKQEVGYQLVVSNLDGPREFHALAAGDELQFERDGVTETVRASNGATTGMKWLAGKQDCLTVKTGEGYCRD